MKSFQRKGRTVRKGNTPIKHGGAPQTKEYPDGTYVGSLDANGNRQSTDRFDGGKMTYNNGDVFEGFWKKDKATGLGVMKYANNGGNYRGSWVDGKRQGEGTMAYPDGSKYMGQWIGDKRNGKGAIQYKNKDEYHGEWMDDKRKNGYGILIYSNDDEYQVEYQGNFVDDKRNGEGVIVYKNGDQYEGEWVDDMKHGQGFMGYSDRRKYKGNWVQDKIQGEGAMTYPDGSTYIGDWVDDKRHGEGVLFGPNREEVYRGNWKNDEQHTTSAHGNTPTASSLSQMSISDLPSKVMDIENDNYSLRLSQIDGNQKDTPIVFLAGKDLYVFTASLIQKVLDDNTSILYDCIPNDQGDYETKKDVAYFNLRRLFTMDGLVPLKLLKKTLVPSMKMAVREWLSVTHKINSIVQDKTTQLSAKKKNIKELLQDNKLPPIIYAFVPTDKKISRMTSKAVAASELDSAVGGFHCQDQGGMQWTVHKIVRVTKDRKNTPKTVKKGRKKTPKTVKKYSNSARSASKKSKRSVVRRSA